jgi:hypothetical protein
MALAGASDVHDVVGAEVVEDIVVVEAAMLAAAGWEEAVGDVQVQHCESLVHRNLAQRTRVAVRDIVLLNLALVSHVALAAMAEAVILDG